MNVDFAVGCENSEGGLLDVHTNRKHVQLT